MQGPRRSITPAGTAEVNANGAHRKDSHIGGTGTKLPRPLKRAGPSRVKASLAASLALALLALLPSTSRFVGILAGLGAALCVGALGLALGVGVFVRVLGSDLLQPSHLEKMAGTSPQMHQQRLTELENIIGNPGSRKPATSPAVVLLTGATGFVGQCVLADLLGRVAELRLHKVLLLCRAARGQTMEDRLRELRELEVLDGEGLRAAFDKVVVGVEADLRAPGLGLSAHGREVLARAKVTHVVHCAAAVSFVEPFADIAGINISAPLALKALSDTWPSCGRFVHVSTAFVDPQNHPSPSAPQPEGLVPLPCKGGREYDPRALYESMCGDTVLAQQAFEALGFVNTYTFSKCVAEHLMARSGRQGVGPEVVIVRPCIVGPSWVSPRPGWGGPKPSTLTGIMALRLGRVLRFFDNTSDATMAVVPVDVVSRVVVYAAFEHPASPRSSHANVLYATWPSSYDALPWFESEVLLHRGLIYSGLLSAPEAAFWLSISRLARAFPLLTHPLHLLANVMPVKLAGGLGLVNAKLVARVQAWLQLTSLYPPYTTRTHLFASRVRVPVSWDMEEYLYDAFLQSRAFVDRSPQQRIPQVYHWRVLSTPPAGVGQMLVGLLHDVAAAVWAPSDAAMGPLQRLASVPVALVLRLWTSGVYVDLQALGRSRIALSSLQKEQGTAPLTLVLAPTRSSAMDGPLLANLALRFPELGLATDYVLEGRCSGDGRLTSPDIEALRRRVSTAHSRAHSGSKQGRVVVLPLSVSYETLPEEQELAMALEQGAEGKGLWRLCRAMWRAYREGQRGGAVRVVMGAPILLPPQSTNDAQLAVAIQEEQRRALVLSPTQAKALAIDLGLAESTVHAACGEVGARVLEPPGGVVSKPLSLDPSVRWLYHLRLLGAAAPLVKKGPYGEHWAHWLTGGATPLSSHQPPSSSSSSEAMRQVGEALSRFFPSPGTGTPRPTTRSQTNARPSSAIPTQILQAWLRTQDTHRTLAQ